MKLIVGLGNPGEQYENTRHNAGFFVLDTLLDRFQVSGFRFQGFKFDKKFGAEVSKVGEVILVKPQAYMNLSGLVLRKIIDYYFDLNLKPETLNLDWLYVLHDDLDIVMGEWKLKFGSGPKEHNGVNSVREALGTDQFWYGRVGVDGRGQVSGFRFQVSEQRLSGRDYVLMQLQREERGVLKHVADEMVEEIMDKLKTDNQ